MTDLAVTESIDDRSTARVFLQSRSIIVGSTLVSQLIDTFVGAW